MPLHRITGSGESEIEDVYATESADQRVPKYRLPEHASSAQAIYNLVHDELLLDGNSRQNLATFCTTWAEPEARQLMDESIDKNMIDKDEYPQTAEIENRCVHMIADLWHAPGAWKTVGCSTTGSSEACMLGGLALKWQWRKRRIAAGKSVRQAELRLRPGAGVLGEVRALFRRGDPPGAAAKATRWGCVRRTCGNIATRTRSA